MTIREAITSADLQRPNQIAESEKLNWLNELEGLVQTRILHLSTDALTSYLPEVSYTGTMSFPDAQTLLLASAGGFCIGDTVKISGLTAYSGNNDLSAKVLSVSADGRTLTFASDTFPSTGGESESGSAYVDRRDTELIVPAPYDRIYEAYLMMRINLYMGEASGYNNDRTWYNTVWDDFSKWFSRNHVPGTTEALGFFLTAYGLALKSGFVGTEQEWLQSLKGDQGWSIGMRYSGEDSALQWCSLGDSIWHDLLTLSDIQGDVVSQTLTAAQTAQSGAETAQAAAESAKADAETARDSANISASSASASALTAEAAQMASESARDTAMAAKTAAETASAATAAKAGEASASASAAANNAAAASASAAAAAVSDSSAVSAKTAAEAAQQAIENMTATSLPLAEGAAPTVEKTVFGGAVSLGFGIPKGDTGATGATGPQGYSIGSVTKKSGTGTAGSTDVYSVKIDDEEQTEVGTFSVYNGADGEGSGDMLKSQYDADNDGVVDDAERLGGQLPGYYAAAADLSLKAGAINGNPATADIAEADYIPLYDTSAAAEKKTLWSTVKSTLKAYFDGLYAALSHTHTKSQITDFPALGTAAAKDVPASGNAGTTQVVMGSDSRLSDSRSAADVSIWAKAAAKPSYTYSEVGAAAAAVSAHNSAADAHSALFASIRQVGEIVTTTRSTLGEKYLLCNGDTVSQATYPELCAILENATIDTAPVITSAITIDGTSYSIKNARKVNGYYVIVCAGYLFYNADGGSSWTKVTIGSAYTLYDIGYGDGYYVISLIDGSALGLAYATSIAGPWTRYTPVNDTQTGSVPGSVIFTGGKFYVMDYYVGKGYCCLLYGTVGAFSYANIGELNSSFTCKIETDSTYLFTSKAGGVLYYASLAAPTSWTSYTFLSGTYSYWSRPFFVNGKYVAVLSTSSTVFSVAYSDALLSGWQLSETVPIVETANYASINIIYANGEYMFAVITTGGKLRIAHSSSLSSGWALSISTDISISVGANMAILTVGISKFIVVAGISSVVNGKYFSLTTGYSLPTISSLSTSFQGTHSFIKAIS